MPKTPSEHPYVSEPFPESHPAHIGAVARLFGLEAAPVEKCSVLELGCASGNNLLPMAWALPEARFVGIDLSAPAISRANDMQRRVGLSNVEFHRQDITSSAASLGQFDYIIAHGIFSWVDERTQEALYELCARHLAPNGVAYISYNAFPGWHMRLALREMMLLETGHIADPYERLRACRTLMDALQVLWREKPSPDTDALLRHLEFHRALPDWFLAHDLLGAENRPEHLGRFVKRASAHGLQYLGDSDLWKMAPFDLSPETLASLKESTDNIVALEQRLDFIRLEFFRRSLLCRKERVLDRDRAILRVPHLLLSGHFTPLSPEGVFHSVIRGKSARIELDDPLLIGAVRALSEAFPRSLDFGELMRAAGIDADRPDEKQAAILIQGLFRLILSGQILPSIWEPPLAENVEPYPVASPVARAAFPAERVCSLLHEPIELEAGARSLLSLVDGSRDVPELAAEWLPDDGTAPAQKQELVAFLLRQFLHSGLLVKGERDTAKRTS